MVTTTLASVQPIPDTLTFCVLLQIWLAHICLCFLLPRKFFFTSLFQCVSVSPPLSHCPYINTTYSSYTPNISFESGFLSSKEHEYKRDILRICPLLSFWADIRALFFSLLLLLLLLLCVCLFIYNETGRKQFLLPSNLEDRARIPSKTPKHKSVLCGSQHQRDSRISVTPKVYS